MIENNMWLMPRSIDLGLPSGTIWSDRNVYALSPVESGAYFSWGNIEPHFAHCGGDEWGDCLDAFDFMFECLSYAKSPGGRHTENIDPCHDAAYRFIGNNWEMPTYHQFEELRKCCLWYKRNIGGVNGYQVISRKTNNSIFLPCNGFALGHSLSCRGSIGGYWAKDIVSHYSANCLSFYGATNLLLETNARYMGLCIRAVRKKSQYE